MCLWQLLRRRRVGLCEVDLPGLLPVVVVVVVVAVLVLVLVLFVSAELVFQHADRYLAEERRARVVAPRLDAEPGRGAALGLLVVAVVVAMVSVVVMVVMMVVFFIFFFFLLLLFNGLGGDEGIPLKKKDITFLSLFFFVFDIMSYVLAALGDCLWRCPVGSHRADEHYRAAGRKRRSGGGGRRYGGHVPKKRVTTFRR